MKSFKIGQVVKLDSKLYLIEPTTELGKHNLIPITLDHSRDSVEVTDKILEQLLPIY